MRGNSRRVEVVKRTIRYELDAPVEAKELGIALHWVRQEFERLNGRTPECDNDYWLEPMDEAIAFVFEVTEEKEETATERADRELRDSERRQARLDMDRIERARRRRGGVDV